MSLFLTTFFLVYGGMHLYAFRKAEAACRFSLPLRIGLVLFMVLMIATPLLVRAVENAGFERSARLLAISGYSWLGLLFLFVSVAVPIDLWRALILLANRLTGMGHSFLPPPRLQFFLPLAAAAAIFVYGSYEARHIRAEHVEIITTKLPQNVARFRIVQISDVHLGLIVRKDRLKRILAVVRGAEPDLLVSTGDLVDGQINGLAGLAEMLTAVKAPYGKFAVTGNHEFYAGLGQSLSFTRRAGFTLLRQNGTTIAGILNVAGVDDPAVLGHQQKINERQILSSLPRDKFTLFLKHRPELERGSQGLFDLQLSGHIHQGQIFPFSLVIKLRYPAPTGLSRSPTGSLLYVSRGSGTWGPPIRFLAPPEVTIIDLVHASS
jgi:predicted MPP superfamily phosphohydrolase